MLLGLPVMFGQVICGVVLGPSALNILTSTIQIETLAELGVFFIMFTVGLEFSPSRIRQVSAILSVQSEDVLIDIVVPKVLALIKCKQLVIEAQYTITTTKPCLPLYKNPSHV